MYRFHPSIKWDGGYPKQNQIVEQVTQLWLRYGLDERTKFDTRVTSISKDKQGRWIVNNPSNGRFDGVIVAVGTCGDPKVPHLPDQEKFNGDIFHSSKLDGKEARGKKVLIVGGGASAVEALQWAVDTGAAHISVLARSEKWYFLFTPAIPRHPTQLTLFSSAWVHSEDAASAPDCALHFVCAGSRSQYVLEHIG
jgi:cation diffusion facilitator CzcD-associated flavoprotein CzcO